MGSKRILGGVIGACASSLLFLACGSGNRSGYANDSMGDPMGTAANDCSTSPRSYECDSNYDCSPYLCNLGTHKCNTSCVGSSGAFCGIGFVCHNMECIKPGTCGVCRSDYDCHDRLAKCDQSRNECKTIECKIDSDCANGHKCDFYRNECKDKCFSDYDCAYGYKCEKYRCVNR